MRKRLRTIIMITLGILLMVQVLALSPSKLESESAEDLQRYLNEDELENEFMDAGQSLIQGLPRNLVPEYSIDDLNYISSKGSLRQWRFLANKSYFYQASQLIHARVATAYIYDAVGNITQVDGAEARMNLTEKKIEFFGNVKTKLSDGFLIESPYLLYLTKEGRVEVPGTMKVHGSGKTEEGKDVAFDSHGIDVLLDQSPVRLPKNVHFEVRDKETPGHEWTTIEADHCTIDRGKSIAYFTMSEKTPVEKRFVKIAQPKLNGKARKGDLFYGKNKKGVNQMILMEDVLIEEQDEKQIRFRYATSGRADFESKRNVITLSDFPQVYQDQDTIVGDRIFIDRTNDQVEVLDSNAYTEGNQE